MPPTEAAEAEPTAAIELHDLGRAYGERVALSGVTPVSYTHLTLPTNREV